MPHEIITVPCRTDNYAYLLRVGDRTALIDVPEAAPILAALDARGWGLDEIWITHHHDDHVEGVPEVRERTGATVTGATADAHRLPPLDRQVTDGETFDFAGMEVRVMDVSGHTVGHVAFHVPEAGAVFTADSLMALGCGRVFEGTMEQMWDSLLRLSALPPETMVYSGHEYTQANARFALTIEPGNANLNDRVQEIAAARSEGKPTVPVSLRRELDTNPFLRAGLSGMKASLDMAGRPDADVFAEIRRRKDSF